jgi:hypothetical protein
MDPRKWPRRAFFATFTTTRTVIKLPVILRDELHALNQLRTTGHVKEMHTLTWKYAELAQLCARAWQEAWNGLVEIYRAPAKLWDDTVRSDDGKRHLLQTVSLCGRKVPFYLLPIHVDKIDVTHHHQP